MRIASAHNLYRNPSAIFAGIFYRLHRVHLILFNPDDCFLDAKRIHRQLSTKHHLIRMLHHHAFIRRQIRLALCSVDQKRVHRFALRDAQLYMGGECGPAGPYNARRLDDLDDLLRRKRHHLILGSRFDLIIQRICPVIFYHDMHRGGACYVELLLNCLHLAGYAGMHRRADKSGRLADGLPYANRIAYFYARMRRHPNVLRHRNGYQLRRLQLLNHLSASQRLSFMLFMQRLYAALFKCKNAQCYTFL